MPSAQQDYIILNSVNKDKPALGNPALWQALRYLDPQRLLLAPDCGLMTISRSLAREKLRVMVEAAAQLRREL